MHRKSVFKEEKEYLSDIKISVLLSWIRKDIRDNHKELVILAKELLRKIWILEGTECWIIKEDWSIYTNFKGYIAHRLMYRLFIGIPIRHVLHKCDRKGCINYEHLFQGTYNDNAIDWRRKKFELPTNKGEEFELAVEEAFEEQRNK